MLLWFAFLCLWLGVYLALLLYGNQEYRSRFFLFILFTGMIVFALIGIVVFAIEIAIALIARMLDVIARISKFLRIRTPAPH